MLYVRGCHLGCALRPLENGGSTLEYIPMTMNTNVTPPSGWAPADEFVVPGTLSSSPF